MVLNCGAAYVNIKFSASSHTQYRLQKRRRPIPEKTLPLQLTVLSSWTTKLQTLIDLGSVNLALSSRFQILSPKFRQLLTAASYRKKKKYIYIYMSGFMKTVLITTTTAWDFSKIIHRLFTQ